MDIDLFCGMLGNINNYHDRYIFIKTQWNMIDTKNKNIYEIVVRLIKYLDKYYYASKLVKEKKYLLRGNFDGILEILSSIGNDYYRFECWKHLNGENLNQVELNDVKITKLVQQYSDSDYRLKMLESISRSVVNKQGFWEKFIFAFDDDKKIEICKKYLTPNYILINFSNIISNFSNKNRLITYFMKNYNGILSNRDVNTMVWYVKSDLEKISIIKSVINKFGIQFNFELWRGLHYNFRNPEVALKVIKIFYDNNKEDILAHKDEILNDKYNCAYKTLLTHLFEGRHEELPLNIIYNEVLPSEIQIPNSISLYKSDIVDEHMKEKWPDSGIIIETKTGTCKIGIVLMSSGNVGGISLPNDVIDQYRKMKAKKNKRNKQKKDRKGIRRKEKIIHS